ncbi:hypothetical protein T484DRAFT_1832534 [Baffinella frigidus]|nr:hypothetical protein T484DRAFT_1832534 [Cryptophyta sp. CCMP2293]
MSLRVVNVASQVDGLEGEMAMFACDAMTWARILEELQALFACKIQKMWRQKRHFTWARILEELQALFACKIQKMWRQKRQFRMLKKFKEAVKVQVSSEFEAEEALEAEWRRKGDFQEGRLARALQSTQMPNLTFEQAPTCHAEGRQALTQLDQKSRQLFRLERTLAPKTETFDRSLLMQKTLTRLRKVEKILAKESRRIRESSRPATSQDGSAVGGAQAGGGGMPFDPTAETGPVFMSEERLLGAHGC